MSENKQRYEHVFVETGIMMLKKTQTALDEKQSEGWELVAVTYHAIKQSYALFFKRPV
jgi:hypothetical protein